MSKMLSLLKKMTGVSSAIFLSRILGFIREVLTAQFLGAGVLASAWQFAFMVPNLARRVFGEGLLVQVLVPVLAQSMEKEGKERAREKFSCIFFYLTLILAGLTLLMAGLALVLRPFVPEGSHWELALLLLPLVMPYCIFICLVGIMSSFLNTLKSFVLPALISLLLNIFMIGCFLFCFPRINDPFDMLEALGYSVILAGALELVLMLFLLKRKGVFPRWNRKSLKDFPTLKEIWRLILPGLAGACGYEISVLCDRNMAMLAGPHALPALTYSERLAYLPVGVIAVAFGTVALPEMARHFARESWEELRELLVKTLHILLYITIPLAFFILLFREEIVRICFMRGRFTLADSIVTARVLLIYAAGIPAFCTVKLLVNFFLAQKDTRTPMYVSLFCIGVNITLNIILLKPMGELGLALATTVSAYLNNILLLVMIRRKSPVRLGKDLAFYSGKVLQMTFFPAVVTVIFLSWYFPGDGKGELIPDLIRLASGMVIFGVFYLFSSLLFSRKELRGVLQKLLRRF